MKIMENIYNMIIWTSMRDLVRSADKSEVSSLQRFVDLKKNGELSDPAMIAGLLIKAMDSEKFVSGRTYEIFELDA